jgi:hypothetical protein
MELLELWNREDSADREHASLMLFAEYYEGMDMESYLSAMQEAYAGESEGGYYSTFDSRESMELNGVNYELLTFYTTVPDSDDIYYEEYYVTEVAENEYFVAEVTYWDGNMTSLVDAMDILNCFSFAY